MAEGTRRPGKFCWIELGTTDALSAKRFYTKLFGWTVEDVPMGEFGTYTLLRRNGKDSGGLYELTEEMTEKGIPPHWLSYVLVKNVEESTKKAASLGATTNQEPVDVMDKGRLSVITDPTGATFALWQAKSHQGSAPENGHGTACHFELVTRSTSAAEKFYSSLFGWSADTKQFGSIRYTMFKLGAEVVAGLMAPTPEMGEVPPHWMVYFEVDRCDQVVDQAEAGGAEIVAPPHDIPNVGRSSSIVDPQGAGFSVIQLVPQPA
jgi:hypothetical protein